MKQIFASVALAIAAMTSVTVNAQNAHEATVKFEKIDENAVAADYDNSAEIVKAALKQRLDKDGLGKMKSSKGFMTYKGTLWSVVSADKLDVYFKVQGKKGKSTVYALVSKGYNNFLTSGTDRQAIENVKTFLNSLQSSVQAYQDELNLKAEEEAMAKAEKARKKAEEKQKDLLAEKEKLQKKIEKNNKEQESKQKALDEEQRKLNDLKAQMN